MVERKSDRWISLFQSVLLHAAVIGALGYGFYAYKKQAKPPPPPTLAIEGTVVDSKSLEPVRPKAEPLPVPPEPAQPPEDVGPPTPTPEEARQREQEEQQQKLEEERRAEEDRVALEKKQAEEKAAAEQQAREEAERKRQQEQREAEQKRLADAKKKAEEKRKAEEDKRRTDEAKAREAELRRSLEAEERLNAIRSSGAMASWVQQIANRIERAWLKPVSAKPGIDCVVHVTQVPGGAVTNVKVGECNGDAAVRQSIEDAVLRASPLPQPPDPALFERDLDIRFRPTD